MALRKDGEGAIISLQGGFYRLDFKTGECESFHDLEPDLQANRRTFAKVDTSNGGAADGSTVGGEGYLWNALAYDGKLVRFASDCSVHRVIEMQEKRVTNVNFGGQDMDVLYVTSMAKPSRRSKKLHQHA